MRPPPPPSLTARSNFFPPALAVLRRLPVIGSLLRLPPGLAALIDRIVNSGRTSNA